MANSTNKTTNEYINSFPADKKARLLEMRKIIQAAAPGTVEAMKWGNPAFTHSDGMILIIFAGYSQHMNLVAMPSTVRALASELSNYKTGKGSIQFSYDKPLPAYIIKKIVGYRVKEYREDGVKWM